MGTRGAFGFLKGGKLKVAYNHFDSYPSCLGNKILFYVRCNNVAKLNRIFDGIELINVAIPPTEEQKRMFSEVADLNVGEQSTNDWYCLFRKFQGKPEYYELFGMMPDDQAFLLDGLFCEWAYIINLDENSFDIYRGFAKESPSDGIFAGYKKIKDRFGEYFPVNRIIKYSLSKLPKVLNQEYIFKIAYKEDVEDINLDGNECFGICEKCKYPCE